MYSGTTAWTGFSPLRQLRQTLRSSSLRARLVLLITVLMLVTVAITAVLTTSLLRQEMVRQIDDDLLVNRDNVSIYLSSVGDSPGQFSSPQAILRFYGELWDNDGQAVHRTNVNPDQDSPVIPGMDADQVAERSGRAFTVPGSAEDSAGWRVQVFRLLSGDGTLAIALPLDTVQSAAVRVFYLVLGIGLLATIGAVVIANIVVTQTFRPLLRVERTAAAIAAGDLTQRVETAPPDTEVGRLSRSLNAMLAKIEAAFRDKDVSERKMRRFIQDASHELRTPLVTIRGFSELYRHGGITKEEDVAAAMGRIEGEATRMHRLVEDLLTLARLDEHRPLEIDDVDLLVLGMDAVMDAKVNAPDRAVTLVGVEGATATSAPTRGDEGKLRQVVTNLVTNALRYTPEGTPIEIAVGTVDVLPGSTDAEGRSVRGARDSVIEIRDHGPGVDEEEASRVFERFYRADSSRHRETGGTGLGLAIVAAIVAQHDGSVRLEQTEGGGATFSVRVPWEAPQDTDDHDDDGADDDLEDASGSPAAGDMDHDDAADAAPVLHSDPDAASRPQQAEQEEPGEGRRP